MLKKQHGFVKCCQCKIYKPVMLLYDVKKLLHGSKILEVIATAHQVPWNKVIYDEFVRLGGLTEEEQQIMMTRMQGWTITKQSMEFHMSVSKVNRIIKRLKVKYDNVQPYSDLLPQRKFSAKETYMDTH